MTDYLDGCTAYISLRVVDDEDDSNFMLKVVLQDAGFIIDAYNNPLQALENFKVGLYDLLILDIKMPEINGFSFYRQIRKLDKKINVCFFTAGEMYYGAYADIFNAVDASHFIRKPITNEDLSPDSFQGSSCRYRYWFEAPVFIQLLAF